MEDRLQAAVNYRERVSTANSLASTVGRSHLNGRVFLNDPDVVMLRDEDNTMSPEERHTLFLLNNIFGGVLFTSDNISRYSPEAVKAYRSMFPFQKKDNIVTREVGDMLKIFVPDRDQQLPGVRKPIEPQGQGLAGQRALFPRSGDAESSFVPGGTEIMLAPHESRLYLAVSDQFFTVAGTSAHLFPGSEIVFVRTEGRHHLPAPARPDEERQHGIHPDTRNGAVLHQQHARAGPEGAGQTVHTRHRTGGEPVKPFRLPGDFRMGTRDGLPADRGRGRQ